MSQYWTSPSLATGYLHLSVLLICFFLVLYMKLDKGGNSLIRLNIGETKSNILHICVDIFICYRTSYGMASKVGSEDAKIEKIEKITINTLQFVELTFLGNQAKFGNFII